MLCFINVLSTSGTNYLQCQHPNFDLNENITKFVAIHHRDNNIMYIHVYVTATYALQLCFQQPML